MNFTYQAREANGQLRTGEVAAATQAEAAQKLRQQGLYVLSVEPLGEGDVNRTRLLRKRPSRAELIDMTSQLAVMVDAGIPLADALDGLARQTNNLTLREMLQQIRRDLTSGEDFSTALAKHPQSFDQTYVNLVRASEASGTLAPMLERIAAQAREQLELAKRVQGAMMYPAVMFVLCVGVCVFLLTYVFPKLLPMFAGREEEIPTPTRVLIAVSDLLRNQWYFVLAAVVALAAGLWWSRRQPWGRRLFDWLWLRLPLVGKLAQKVAVSRSIRTLATTVAAGVPMLEALRLCAGVSNNVFFEEAWLAVSEQVTAGKQIHETMRGNQLFPETLVQMIASGEQTGKLAYVLEKVADHLDREVALTLKQVTALIEPLMVALMGGMVGGIALAMLLPIFKLSSMVG